MKDVSCKVFELFFKSLKTKGVDPETIVEGTNVALATLYSKKERLDWSDFCAVMTNMRKHFTDEEYVDLGRRYMRIPALRFAFVIARLLMSPMDLYRWFSKPREGLAIRSLRRDEVPASEYTKKHRPRYVLVANTELAAPLERVFPFFSAAENLQLLTPPGMRFVIVTPTPIPAGAGTVIDYKLAILGIPARWRTVIERWQNPRAGEALFVDAQHRGPYASWWHEHHFYARGDRTLMQDRVYYAPPFGLLGAIANRVVITGQLKRIFGYRNAMIRLRFGAAGAVMALAS